MVQHTQVTVYYLEALSPRALKPSTRTPEGVEIHQAEIPSPELNRYLYAAVGGQWYWRERLAWSYARWMELLDRDTYETWVAYERRTPAGYFELEKHADSSVEIVYFGLLPAFVGKGIGGLLLTTAISRAWSWGAQRVWVHTCTLDHPNALQNYQARGMRIYRQDDVVVNLPDAPSGPWAGAHMELSLPATGKKT
jgi:GNAT superfamily N-acetyltransferase